jgi:hypothetical protein
MEWIRREEDLEGGMIVMTTKSISQKQKTKINNKPKIARKSLPTV